MSDVRTEVFGYGIAHRDTKVRLYSAGRKVYDSKGAASKALNNERKVYDKHKAHALFADQYIASYHLNQNPHDFELVELVAR